MKIYELISMCNSCPFFFRKKNVFLVKKTKKTKISKLGAKKK